MSELTITCAPVGTTGMMKLTARLNGDSFTDRLCIERQRDRERFAATVAERWSSVNQADVERQLDKLADEHAQESEKPAVIGPELDLSRIVRPERFIAPAVSGLAVPLFAEIAGRPVGRWVLMLQWADGRREQVDLPGKLALPGGGCLWIAPTPADPTPSMARSLAGWSAASRRAWLDGAAAPDPAEVFKRLCERTAYFIDVPEDAAAGTTATLALWVLLTYGYVAFDATPYLHVGGPLGSGKSRVFEILLRAAFRPLASSSMTGPALFRTLHNQGGVLLLDEAERLRQPTPETGELLSMLLAGYKRGGQATRLEPVGDSFKTVAFEVFGPKALACIAGLPPALASRCISVRMFRAGPDSPKPRRRIDADPDGWQSLRDDLHALAFGAGAAWLDMARKVDVVPGSMTGRDFELWQPLLALANWIEAHGAAGLLKLVQDFALASIEAAQDDQTPDADETLLRILAEQLRAGLKPTPGDILAKAIDVEGASFKTWKARGVAEHLKRYTVTTHKSAGRKVYGKKMLDALKRIQANYNIDLGFEADTTPENVPQRAPSAPDPDLPLKNAG